MRTIFFLFCLFFFGLNLPGQVVNTERLRINKKTEGWAGQVDVQLGMVSNKAGETVQAGGVFNAEWSKERHRLFLFTAVQYGRIKKRTIPEASTVFGNRQFAHLRFNEQLNRRLTWEAFVQNQSDKVQEIEWRFLSGAGLRFTLADRDSFKCFLGALYMFEYEQTNEILLNSVGSEAESVFRRDHRFSGYLSLALALSDYLEFNHVTYYQPRLDYWGDFRISTETTFQVSLNGHLKLTNGFQLVYDSFPPAGVPRVMFNLRNGLGWNF